MFSPIHLARHVQVTDTVEYLVLEYCVLSRAYRIAACIEPYESLRGNCLLPEILRDIGSPDRAAHDESVVSCDYIRGVVSRIEATVSDIIVSANTVRIKTGFKGRAQIFCSDSVIVEAGAKLEYPSGIYMENTNPYIEIRTGSSIYGYIVVKDNDVSSRQICYAQKPGASIKGLLYVDGICDLKGHISGAAYIKDCFHRDRDYLYSKTLHDIDIERNDSIAYPILLSGTYTRKPIKNLH